MSLVFSFKPGEKRQDVELKPRAAHGNYSLMELFNYVSIIRMQRKIARGESALNVENL